MISLKPIKLFLVVLLLLLTTVVLAHNQEATFTAFMPVLARPPQPNAIPMTLPLTKSQAFCEESSGYITAFVAHPTNPSQLIMARRDGRVQICDMSTNQVQQITQFPAIYGANHFGLLGLDIDSQGRIYVAYSDADKTAIIESFDLDNPDIHDPIMTIPAKVPTTTTHHIPVLYIYEMQGRTYLLLLNGDGEFTDTPENLPQDNCSIWGKILRLQVRDEKGVYAISTPIDNPGQNAANCTDDIHEMVFASGVRHPWGAHIDEGMNQFYFADVGNHLWEEVDKLSLKPATTTPNFGWPAYEGGSIFNANYIDPTVDYQMPFNEYANSSPASYCGASITGGSLVEIDGRLAILAGDFCLSILYAMWLDGTPPTVLIDSAALGMLPIHIRTIDGVVMTSFRGVYILNSTTQP